MIRVILILCFVLRVCLLYPQGNNQRINNDSQQSPSFADVKKGDIIDINGVKAIVFQTYGNGHGKAMCIKALRGKQKAWCPASAKKGFQTTDRNNGKANTEALFRFIKSNSLDINDFPAVVWCKSLGDGWYIPAIQELEAFIKWWLGNDMKLDWDDESPDQQDSPINETRFSKQVNKQILEAGGIPFINGAFTSTESKQGYLSAFRYNDKKGYWQFETIPKASVGIKYMARAFYEF